MHPVDDVAVDGYGWRMEIPDDFDETCGILYIPETIEFHEPNDEFLDKLIEHMTELLAEHLKAPLDPDKPPPRMPLIVRTQGAFEEAQEALAVLREARDGRAGCRQIMRLIPYEEWLAEQSGN